MSSRIPQVTIFAKQAGVAIAPYEKRVEGRPAEGRIALRFFKLESGSSPIRFVAEPAEAFELAIRMGKVATDGGRESFSHRFDGRDGEVQTRLTVESWERDGKSGCALSVQRGEEHLNVPVNCERFLHAAEFLRHLAVQQAWVEEFERPQG